MFTFSAPWATETVEGYVRSGRREERRSESAEQRAEGRRQKAESWSRIYADHVVKAGARHGGDFKSNK